MILAVVGSRTINDYKLIKNFINKLKVKPIKIKSGGANGVDKLAERYAKENKIEIEVIKPNWEQYGKSAGYIRNKEIIKETNLILAVWDGESKGTLHSINLAFKYLLNVITINNDGKIIKEYSKLVKPIYKKYKWSRVVKRGEPYYECSSKGDKRYSALVAKIGNKTIEEIYQLDIKGYREITDDWREGKGKPPIFDITIEEQYEQYLDLWREYFLKNKNLYLNILKEAKEKTITDMFGVTPINQARAICDLCNKGLLK